MKNPADTVVLIAPCPVIPAAGKYKRQHQAGLSLLRQGLQRQYQLNLSERQISEQLIFGKYGKPALKDYPDIHFNISHCDGWVGCAFSDRPVGLDLEMVAPFPESMLHRVLTPDEQQFLQQFRDDRQRYQTMFYRFWTLKESRIKQNGCGLSMDMTSFSFDLPEVELSGQLIYVNSSEPHLHFAQMAIEKDVILSVCSEKTMLSKNIFLIYADSELF